MKLSTINEGKAIEITPEIIRFVNVIVAHYKRKISRINSVIASTGIIHDLEEEISFYGQLISNRYNTSTMYGAKPKELYIRILYKLSEKERHPNAYCSRSWYQLPKIVLMPVLNKKRQFVIQAEITNIITHEIVHLLDPYLSRSKNEIIHNDNETNKIKRKKNYFNYLHHRDETEADMAAISYEIIRNISRKLPKEKIRDIIKNSDYKSLKRYTDNTFSSRHRLKQFYHDSKTKRRFLNSLYHYYQLLD